MVVGGGYRAGSSLLATDDVSALPDPTWTIPGGRNARTRIPDWEEHTGQIGAAIEALHALPNVDTPGPAIEYHRSRRDFFSKPPYG